MDEKALNAALAKLLVEAARQPMWVQDQFEPVPVPYRTHEFTEVDSATGRRYTRRAVM